MTSSIQSRLEDYRRMELRHLPVLAVNIGQIPLAMGEPRQSVHLELLKERCSGKIALKFTGVQDLKIERIHPGTTCHLEIVSVVNEQLEGLRFRVFNDEQDFVLSFYCFDFEINELPIGN
jgi:hypothetical protein